MKLLDILVIGFYFDDVEFGMGGCLLWGILEGLWIGIFDLIDGELILYGFFVVWVWEISAVF